MTPADTDTALVADSGLFDAAWYRRQDATAAAASDAIADYLGRGAALGLEPGPEFSGRHYLLRNPDVAAAGVNPLVHYLRFGRSEGRIREPVSAPLPGSAPPGREPARVAEEATVIEATGLFDAAWYLATYGDVRESGIDPLRHFLEYGAAEGRRPNPYFDPRRHAADAMAEGDDDNPLAHYARAGRDAETAATAMFDGRWYRARYPDAAASPLPALAHFLRYGIPAGRDGIPPVPGAFAGAPVADLRGVRCTVVVPIHEAADAVARGLAALFANSSFGGADSLLLIDDGSADPAIAALLAPLEGRAGVRVERQPRNLGYTRTVNRGIALAGRDDVVLLNSDTEVGPHWLRRLKATATRDPRIGSVTAVSNAAGEFSVPTAGNHPFPTGADVDTVARAVADVAGAPFEVPTGNGFCLYLRRAMLDAVGDFDEVAFPVGYGEENDLCMRAGDAGWTHLVDPSVYVRHARSASFGDRREALAEAGFARVVARHPDYEAAIRAIGASPRFVDARYRIGRRLAVPDLSPPRPRILFVISTRVGGTPQTNLDLMRALAPRHDAFALCSDGGALELLRAGADGYETVDRFALAEPLRFATHGSREYDGAVRALMLRQGIDLLHVRHLAWHGLGLVDAARSLGIPVVMSFHDYYCVCPTVHLLDADGVLHPRGVAQPAANPLWHHDPTALPMDAARLAEWQRRMQRALAGASAFVTTSPAARRLVRDALPGLPGGPDAFHVIPHGRDFRAFAAPATPARATPSRPLRILLPGNLSTHKGAGLIGELARADGGRRFELHVLGQCPPELRGLVVEHGTYERETFGDLVARIAPDLAAILSVWPETYCHTLAECWASGLPVVGVDIGAVGERIGAHGGGWLLPFPATAGDLHRLLDRLATDLDDRQARAAEVARWQDGEGRRHDTAWMASRYAALYAPLLRDTGGGD